MNYILTSFMMQFPIPLISFLRTLSTMIKFRKHNQMIWSLTNIQKQSP